MYSEGHKNYRAREMKPDGKFIYKGSIPHSPGNGKFKYYIEAIDTDGRKVTYPPKGIQNPIVLKLTNDYEPPELIHEPVTDTPAEKPLKITAKVNYSSGIKWVRVRYRGVTQYQEYQTLPMRSTGGSNMYEAVIPGNKLAPEWDFMYFFEVMDNQGNGKIYPDLEKETPYILVKLDR